MLKGRHGGSARSRLKRDLVGGCPSVLVCSFCVFAWRWLVCLEVGGRLLVRGMAAHAVNCALFVQQ